MLPHAARVARAAAIQWQRAVDDEDVDSLAVLTDATAALVDLVLDDRDEDQPVVVAGWVSDIDGARVVQIDTTEGMGRVRVYINDGAIYDGDPDTDPPPGAHYGAPDWGDDQTGSATEHCAECGATTEVLVSADHDAACSLNPANVVPQVRRAALIARWIDDVGVWGDVEEHPRAAWRTQVCDERTQLGYWEWVEARHGCR